MPVNNWNHTLFLTDVIPPIFERTGDFAELRDELVRRIRAADWYDETDIVLRSLVNDLASAGCVEQLDPDYQLFTLWADQDQRLWVETTLSREEYDEIHYL